MLDYFYNLFCGWDSLDLLLLGLSFMIIYYVGKHKGYNDGRHYWRRHGR